jgi:hypothetical protein
MAVGRAPGVSEYQVKGAYVFNFIRLIDWPSSAASGTMLPLCVLGESPLTGVLDRMGATPLKGRRTAVRVVPGVSAARGCEVLVIPQAASQDLESVVRALPAGVLTISEIDTDDRVSSVINFVVENDRVSFDVNAEAAGRAQLTVSARLLSVARAVDGRRRRRD